MTTDNVKPSAPKVLPLSELLEQTTTLCNELDELMCVHHFYYQAVEWYFGEQTSTELRGLSLMPQWLHQRNSEVLNAAHQLQQYLRDLQHI